MSPPHSDWSSDEDGDGGKQKERERISEIIKIQDKKIAKEKNMRKVKEGTLPCIPDLPSNKQNLPPTNPTAPAQEKEKKQTVR